jgi:hypothetical protein
MKNCIHTKFQREIRARLFRREKILYNVDQTLSYDLPETGSYCRAGQLLSTLFQPQLQSTHLSMGKKYILHATVEMEYFCSRPDSRLNIINGQMTEFITHKYEGYSESNLCLFQSNNVGTGESSRKRGSIT